MMMEPDESENISSKTKRQQSSVDDKTFEKISLNSRNETIIVKK